MDDFADRDGGDGGGDHYRAPLLLHSLAEFREIIFRCLDLAEITSVAEVGAEDGHFSSELLSWSDGRDVRVVAIDPAPSAPLIELASANPRLELVAATSLTALETIEPVDAYLIDGDHNYYTVSNELRLIEERTEGEFPVVFMHDVAWPCGRRDQYYAPDQIPEESRHEYTYERGVIPSNTGVVPGGFRGQGEFAVALVEGGPRNGVQTAIDDFLARRADLDYGRVPCVFGLGVLYPRKASYAVAVTDIVRSYEAEPLLDRLERNRLALYLALLTSGDDRSAEAASFDQAVKETQLALDQAKLHIRDLETENKALWARQHELIDRAARAEADRDRTGAATDQLTIAMRKLLASKPYRAADFVARLRSRSSSRRDLEAILGELEP
jgi:hypothetical protein